MMLRYWPSALLSLVLLIGICACFKRVDYAQMDEVRAMISILFGFATSCLLLSFIWLIQRKPFNGRPWLNERPFSHGELPSMHPEGRVSPVGQSSMIGAISHADLNDRPPCYKDALDCSRPDYHDLCDDCCFHKYSFIYRTSILMTAHESGISKSMLNNHKRTCRNCSSETNTTESLKPAGLGPTNEPTSSSNNSFMQLDVEQLVAMSSSPPKYHELMLGIITEAQHIDSNNDMSDKMPKSGASDE